MSINEGIIYPLVDLSKINKFKSADFFEMNAFPSTQLEEKLIKGSNIVVQPGFNEIKIGHYLDTLLYHQERQGYTIDELKKQIDKQFSIIALLKDELYTTKNDLDITKNDLEENSKRTYCIDLVEGLKLWASLLIRKGPDFVISLSILQKRELAKFLLNSQKIHPSFIENNTPLKKWLYNNRLTLELANHYETYRLLRNSTVHWNHILDSHDPFVLSSALSCISKAFSVYEDDFPELQQIFDYLQSSFAT